MHFVTHTCSPFTLIYFYSSDDFRYLTIYSVFMIKHISGRHPTDTSWMLLMWFNSVLLLSGFVRVHLLMKLIRGDIFTSYCMVGHTHP